MSLRDCVSPTLGIIGKPVELLRDADDPPFYLYSAATGDLKGILGCDDRLFGAGAGATQSEAMTACIGEALERYANLTGCETETRFCTWRELGEPTPHPSRYALFSADQYAAGIGMVPFEETSKVEWIRATDLLTGEGSWVPAQLTQLRHEYREGEERIGYSTSSGSGLGASPQQAILTGLFEGIERDATMRAWLLRLRPPIRRNLTVADLGLPNDWDFFLSEPQCVLWDLSALVGIPTAMAAIRGVWPVTPTLAFGSASAPTFQIAARKAAIEAYHTRAWAKSLIANRNACEPDEALINFEDHVYLYAHPAAAAACDFLFHQGPGEFVAENTDFVARSQEGILAEALRRLASRGIGCLSVDITTVDLRQSGLTAAHTLCPELCRLSVGLMPKFLGSGLLGEFGRSGRGGPDCEAPLNLAPHPFP